jgi:hypothetical protein
VVDEAPDRLPRHVDQVYPYTLKGPVDALQEAALRSYGDNPQLLLARSGEESKVIRRFEHGREVDLGS